jgi:hypothetical protein
MRGIGFSPADHRGHWPFGTDHVELRRLDDALEKVVENGYNMIRVWRMTPYQNLTLQRIRDKNLDIKVQIAVDCDHLGGYNDEIKRRIDNAVAIAQQFPELILGLSLGNENMGSWFHGIPHDMAYKIKDRAVYAKQRYGIPVTYNFVSEDVWNKHGFDELVQELDYVNMHMYGSIFSRDGQSWYTPEVHFKAVKEDENIRYQRIPNDKPLVIGETGWLDNHRRPWDLRGSSHLYDYYKLITKHIYGTPLESRKAVSMFYFVLSNEGWKGHDNGWGLYDEGDKDVIGEPGTGAPRIPVVNVDEILNMRA